MEWALDSSQPEAVSALRREVMAYLRGTAIRSRTSQVPLLAVERERPTLVVIDLRGLDFMDSTSLNQLIRATRRARSEQRRVVLVMGRQSIDRIFAVSGVERAFETTAGPATLDH